MFDLWDRATVRNAFTRHQDLLDEAKQARLARLAQTDQITLAERLAGRCGNILISAGLVLKRRSYARRRAFNLSMQPIGSRMEY